MSNSAFFIAAQAGVVPMVEGNPGCGKTASVMAFGRALRRPVHVLIGSIREPVDLTGYPCLDNGLMRFAPTDWVLAANKEPSIIFFDELTTCPPAVQAAMLRVMNEKYVGDVQLREDTIICAACNPLGSAANGQELEPALANRLVHLKWRIDWDQWRRGMLNNLNFDNPQFPILPKDWKDTHLTTVASLVGAFSRHKQSLFDAYPQNERSKACGAWPSQRSWTVGVLCLAAAQSVSAGEAVEQELLTGCIGEGAAIEFDTWRNSLDLPDPRAVLEWGKHAIKGKKTVWPAGQDEKQGKGTEYVHPDRADKAIALLSGVAGIAMQEKDAKALEAAVHVMKMASDHQFEIAVMCMQPLAKSLQTTPGVTVDAQFLTRIGVVLTKVHLDN